MGTKIMFQAAGIEVTGELNDSPTAQAIAQALPLEAAIHTWGQEIYFAPSGPTWKPRPGSWSRPAT